MLLRAAVSWAASRRGRQTPEAERGAGPSDPSCSQSATECFNLTAEAEEAEEAVPELAADEDLNEGGDEDVAASFQ